MLLTPPPFLPSGGTSLVNELKNLGLLTNLKLCLDAGDANSYDGSSQTWKDLSGGGYDFYRGSGSGSDGADPTFNGTAGRESSGEYFSYDGGDYLTLAQANPSWLQPLHKANAKLTIVEWIYLNSISSTAQAGAGVGDCTRSDGAAYNGFQFGLSSNTLRAVNLALSNASPAVLSYDKDSTATLSNNAWNFAAVSADFSTGVVIFQINGTTETYTSQTLTTPSTGSAESTLQIAALGAGQFPDATGCRIASLLVCDAALTGAALLSLYNATKSKFGL